MPSRENIQQTTIEKKINMMNVKLNLHPNIYALSYNALARLLTADMRPILKASCASSIRTF
jgi:hypothetical protein